MVFRDNDGEGEEGRGVFRSTHCVEDCDIIPLLRTVASRATNAQRKLHCAMSEVPMEPTARKTRERVEEAPTPPPIRTSKRWPTDALSEAAAAAGGSIKFESLANAISTANLDGDGRAWP